MDQTLILLSLFVAVLLVTFAISNFFIRRAEISRNIGSTRARRSETDAEIDRILGSENEDIRYYLDVVQTQPVNSLPMRLVQAGYFSKSAVTKFNIIRSFIAAAVFSAVQFGTGLVFEQLSTAVIIVLAMLAAGLAFVLCSAVLENIGKRRSREFKKIFPDFLDLLLVCVDSGLGIEAAIERVTREFLLTTKDFGVQLSIINLEIRAGRPLHEALNNFSKRIALDEARTLAVLFKQSQELGASVGKTLRVFAREMRQLRIIRAEEKANSLPVKMLFPMAVFMFPVNLIIVLVPILMTIIAMLSGLAPS
ncbi:type II secretion system F family protein [Sulfitobacter aestuariivivens]|uniref:Type II secretion system F family protein n=1 Tax=Sulfitobacter aestuariivivens TaxID=2766981 RepID=A0A927D875_9RHOB|nr:type II secretion system F family protein [Sulfitobacter aestuariivivens]MBD3666216.1 type II secretion system F family protein [Sulfitobacter aestuariivivens]